MDIHPFKIEKHWVRMVGYGTWILIVPIMVRQDKKDGYQDRKGEMQKSLARNTSLYRQRI